MDKFELQRIENNISREMRNHPFLTMLGLILIVRLLTILGGPVMAYAMNVLGRAQYRTMFFGREGTAAAIHTWEELIAELNAISDMGMIGEMLVTMPSIFRVITMVITVALFFLMLYFAFNMWEAMQDHYKEIEKGVRIMVVALKTIIIALWKCMSMFFEGVLIVLKCLVIVIGVATLRTYYGIRKMYRKGRRAYRRYKANKYQPKYLKQM